MVFPEWPKYCRRKELWYGIISFPLIKDGPVAPILKKLGKEALKLLSLQHSNSSYYADHFWVFLIS